MKHDMERKWKCDDCHRTDVSSAPMLHDSVWVQLADKHETLCDHCMWQRVRERKVHLSLSSLKPCPVNPFHWPRSSFNLFALMETPPTRVDPEWRGAWNDLKPTKVQVRFRRPYVHGRP
jgi:hypothetical protein